MFINNNSLPPLLYHGSRYKQRELMPGFKRSGKLVKWDQTESNVFLYATSERNTAIELGFASSIEKLFKVTHFRVQNGEIRIETDISITKEMLYKVPVYLYKIQCNEKDGWKKNNNKHNGITTEYKTQQTIFDILLCEPVDISEWLKGYNVTLVNSTQAQRVGMESLKVPTVFSW